MLSLSPFATWPSRQQHQVDLKDGVPVWQPGDDIILALRIQIHPVLLHAAIVLCQSITQQLRSICQGSVCRNLDGGQLVAAGVHSTYSHLHHELQSAVVIMQYSCDIIVVIIHIIVN